MWHTCLFLLGVSMPMQAVDFRVVACKFGNGVIMCSGFAVEHFECLLPCGCILKCVCVCYFMLVAVKHADAGCRL